MEQDSTTQGPAPAVMHLESALQTQDSAKKNYHVRQAMQLLIADEGEIPN